MEVHDHNIVENWEENQLDCHQHFTDAVIHVLKLIRDLDDKGEYRHLDNWMTPQTLERFIRRSTDIQVEKYDEVKETVSVSRIRDILHTYWDGTKYIKRKKAPEHVRQHFQNPAGLYVYKYMRPEELEKEKERKKDLRQKMIDAGITEI